MAHRARRSDRLIVAIGVFKLVKCVLLLGLGVAGLYHVTHDGWLTRVAGWTGLLAGHRLIRGEVARLESMDERALGELAIGALVYAVVFAVEGVGLMMRKRWAEWLTVGVTASFIPIEVYEMVRRPGAGKVVTIATNVAIVAYLVWRRVTDSPRLSRFLAA